MLVTLGLLFFLLLLRLLLSSGHFLRFLGQLLLRWRRYRRSWSGPLVVDRLSLHVAFLHGESDGYRAGKSARYVAVQIRLDGSGILNGLEPDHRRGLRLPWLLGHQLALRNRRVLLEELPQRLVIHSARQILDIQVGRRDFLVRRSRGPRLASATTSDASALFPTLALRRELDVYRVAMAFKRTSLQTVLYSGGLLDRRETD
mmetsp:Transcript_111905/g.316226  ORF Transcript_111905/g.316226 Transcript_111905/m.316226 type:complete len:202 (+) Transcript_111905:2064-2669(+)